MNKGKGNKMKPIKIISTILLLAMNIQGFSNPVDIETAKRVAQSYMNLSRQSSKTISDIVLDVVAEKSEDQNSFYVVNFRGGGWVMVSAENLTIPILAYSHTGIYRAEDEKPPGFLLLISGYKEQVDFVRKNSMSKKDSISARSSEITEMWSQLLSDENNSNMLRSSTKTVYGSYTVGDSLLYDQDKGYVAWGQSKNNDDDCNPSYNMFAPSNNGCDCGKTPIGCAAVAMGQVMWYWQYPKVFNWDLMPAKLYEGDTAEGSEIARLLRLCADGAGMVYTCAGSFAAPALAATAMRGFGFKTATMESSFDWGGSSWSQLIRTEISCSRPVIYKAEKALLSGEKHYFVIDGYDNLFNLKFHMNFGWRGAYNGFFHLDNIIPGSHNYNATITHKAIIGISPAYASAVNITDVSYSTVAGRAYEDARQNISLPASGKSLTVENGGSLTLAAGNSVILRPGFHVKAGGKFTAKIDPANNINMEITVPSWPTVAYNNEPFYLSVNNANSSDFTVRTGAGNVVFQSAHTTYFDEAVLWLSASPSPGVYNCTVRLRNNYGRMLEHTWDVTVKNRSGKSAINNDSVSNFTKEFIAKEQNVQNSMSSIYDDFNFSIHPNPNNGRFNVALYPDSIDNFELQITNQFGVILFKEDINNNSKIIIPNVQPGVYFVTVKVEDGILTKKIIVQ